MSSDTSTSEVPTTTSEPIVEPTTRDGVPVGPTLDVYEPTTDEYSLPSGLCVELREALLVDQDRLAAKSLQRSGMGLLSLLKGCTTRVMDPGPYPFLKAGDKVDWSRVSQEDVLAGLFHLRKLTYDETELTFEVVCPDPMCQKKFEHTVELETLPYNEMSARARESISTGRPLEWIFKKAKMNIRWEVITGVQSTKIAMLLMEGQQKGGKDTALQHETFCAMIKGIEGKALNDIRRTLQFLPLNDKRAFQAEIDDAQGGYNVVVKIDCVRCNRTIQEVVSVGSDFFSEVGLPSISGSTSENSSPS